MRLFFLAVCLFLSSHLLADPQPRDYHFLTPQLEQDMRYVITSLGTKSYPNLFLVRSQLAKSGDRLRVLHPIRSLLYILSDEKLARCFYAMHASKRIWNAYLHGENGNDGLLDSLEQECAANGLHPSHLNALAAQIGANSDQVQDLARAHRWEELVELVLESIMKTEKSNPYNDV